ncbi:MAG TPA: hypothetical protein EYP04_04340 [Anaerolineae bacterium]|nr:hypothetical protein [Anaerolineae bacterium]HIQ05359.1 hypothetical protein [Anaerolineae bacterium]
MVSTEELRYAFTRRVGLRILSDLNQLKKTVRNGRGSYAWKWKDLLLAILTNSSHEVVPIHRHDESRAFDPEQVPVAREA